MIVSIIAHEHHFFISFFSPKIEVSPPFEILHILKRTQCHYSLLRLVQPGLMKTWTSQVTSRHFNNWMHTCRLSCICSLASAGPHTCSLDRFCIAFRQDCGWAIQESRTSWSRSFSFASKGRVRGRTPLGFLPMLCVLALRLGRGVSQKTRNCSFASLNWQYYILNGGVNSQR